MPLNISKSFEALQKRKRDINKNHKRERKKRIITISENESINALFVEKVLILPFNFISMKGVCAFILFLTEEKEKFSQGFRDSSFVHVLIFVLRQN